MWNCKNSKKQTIEEEKKNTWSGDLKKKTQ